MKKIIILILLILIIILAATQMKTKQAADTTLPQIEDIALASRDQNQKPIFTWSYAPSEKNEIPMTTISLTARYPDNTTETKQIETIEGGCEEYQTPSADIYEESTMIICYYAGFGRYYKVIATDAGYAVQRKEFEEASPDYNPPIQQFKTIARF